jgi:microcystin-dependent protein
MASVAKWRDDMAGSLQTGGSNTAFTITSNQVFASLSAMGGQTIAVRMNATNGASPTLNVDSLGAKAIQIDATTAVPTGALRKNGIYWFTYDNSATIWIVQNGHSLVEPGRIAPHGASAIPNGWLLCNGQILSRTTYADLFAAVSTTYGSSDSLTFKAPDLTGRVPAGLEASATRLTGAVSGINGGSLGAAGGAEGNTISQTYLPNVSLVVTIPSGQGSHIHGLVSGGSVIGSAGTGSVQATGTADGPTTIAAATLPQMGPGNWASLGGSGTTFPVTQPTLIVNYVIKF